jgi:hypothetical protein
MVARELTLWYNYVGRSWNRTLSQVVYSYSEVEVRHQFACLRMTARGFGWRRNGFPKDVLSGGQPGLGRHAHWKRIKHSYSLPRAIQIHKRLRCGGE